MMKKILLATIISALLLVSCGNADTPVGGDVTTSGSPAATSEAAQDEVSVNPDVVKVADAYLTGDASALSETELELLDLAKSAVSEFYTDGMSGYDVCLAAHDWIVTHVTYDTGTLAVIPKATPYSDCAYGALKSGKAICSGYTESFKLFMDMLGVENTVVHGSSVTSVINGEPQGDEHAWNMVCLDGKWYHIDCTWDDFVPDYDDRSAHHMYTFLTDGEMELTSHAWDKSLYPKAEDRELNYYKNHGLYAQNTDEAVTILERAIASGAKYAEVAIPMPFVDIMYDGVSAWATFFDDYYVLAFTIYR